MAFDSNFLIVIIYETSLQQKNFNFKILRN